MRTVKGLILEIKMSDNHDMRVLAEETLVNIFSDLKSQLTVSETRNKIYRDAIEQAKHTLNSISDRNNHAEISMTISQFINPALAQADVIKGESV